MAIKPGLLKRLGLFLADYREALKGLKTTQLTFLSPLLPLSRAKTEAQNAGLASPGSHSPPLGPSLDSQLPPGLGPTPGSDK